MDILNADLLRYAEQHTSSESELLKRINRETHAQVLMPRMLSGHLQGRLLAMISCMLQPKVILEIGTYTGYSAVCLAEGLAPDGKLITIDINEELEERVRQYFNEAGLSKKVDYQIGNALDIIPKLQGPFDLVFIDADKENYARYYDLVFNLVPLGGYILADNVLWSGKVLDQKPDKDTRAIMDFNRKIQNDTRVENILMPVRDGIMIARKVKD
ncbi:MAG: class I SAM-dependent methyltransferase [Cyclobacteriaceae bacterium]|nr:class I SAM-dependent methyltransferase [Cyclobacteriaceae bacterium]